MLNVVMPNVAAPCRYADWRGKVKLLYLTPARCRPDPATTKALRPTAGSGNGSPAGERQTYRRSFSFRECRRYFRATWPRNRKTLIYVSLFQVFLRRQ